MESDIVKHHWDDIRKQPRTWWVELADKDLKDIEGDRAKLIRLLQTRYGYSRQKVEQEIDRRLNDYIRFVH